MSENVELKVVNVFHLQDGRTVLAVEVADTQSISLLPSGLHEVVLDGQSMRIVEVVSEMIPRRSLTASSMRAVMLATRLDHPSGSVAGCMTLVPCPASLPVP